MKIDQSTRIADPQQPHEVANKRYVDQIAATIGAGAAAPVFITNVTNQGTGIIGNKQYVPNTVPANTVLTSATTDDDTVTLVILAEGGSFYSPTITVSGEPALPGGQEGATIPLTQDQYDKRTFTGSINLTIAQTTLVTVTSSTGATSTAEIVRAAAGPEMGEFTIGSYPGSQTAARSGQVMSFSGVVENSAVAVDIVDFGAGAAKTGAQTVLGVADSGGVGYKTVTGTFTVSSRSGTLALRARARNALGTPGTNRDSSNTIVLDQALPTITGITVTYPGVQEAVKGTEQATVSFTLQNTENSSANAANPISILSGNTSLSQSITVQGTGSGDQVTGTNFAITANKPSNGSTSTVNVLVKVVNTAQVNTISIVGNPARLISSPTGQAYTVYIESNLDLIGDGAGQSAFAPTFTASLGLLSNITRINDKRWQATLTIRDVDAKGAGLFDDVSTTGLSGIQVTTATGTAYTVGGFSERTLVIPLYDATPGSEIIGRTVDIGTAVGDVTKLVANLSGTPLTFTPDVNDAVLKFTIVDQHQGFTDPYVQVAQYKADGSIFYLNDRDQAGANTTGTMTVTLREDA